MFSVHKKIKETEEKQFSNLDNANFFKAQSFFISFPFLNIRKTGLSIRIRWSNSATQWLAMFILCLIVPNPTEKIFHT